MRQRPASRSKSKASRRRAASASPRRVGYAVVGLGHIAQAAVLPAFAHASPNSRLVALVSGDATKRAALARRYSAPHVYDYEHFQDCLARPDVEAVYIALPNFLHREYGVAAARAGKHVLCEKPLAVTPRECEDMIQAAAESGVRLMTAYRLHFERANLEAIEIVRSGQLGEPRVFQSLFAMQVVANDARLSDTDRGGGPIYDIGVYCINAARYLFRAEPSEVLATSASIGGPRFERAPEMMSVILRFPVERLAAFTCSLGAADAGWYQVLGTRGDLRVDPAFEYGEPLVHRLTIEGKTRERRFPKRDQFAPELLYFSDCILADREPEPSGREGLADVRIIRAALESARTGSVVRLDEFERHKRPTLAMESRLPPVARPRILRAEAPSQS
ncbi:MAG TPA: Gfo/Idh/MocA family oxidoreductase [Thermoanaerobaculia bacterium]|nr:Gfo/Idh/MocA family oxidoreductase [Thermoanaerobaculia bacterium]